MQLKDVPRIKRQPLRRKRPIAQPIPEKRRVVIPQNQEEPRQIKLGEYVTIHGFLYQVAKVLKRKIVLTPSKRTITKRNFQ